mgnify:CR=1 FL=1
MSHRGVQGDASKAMHSIVGERRRRNRRGSFARRRVNLAPMLQNSLFRSPTTGLVYMRNRWYSPRLGQFVSHDPLEYVDSSNLYAFAAFDPINKWDPFGLESDKSSKPDPKVLLDEPLQLVRRLHVARAAADHHGHAPPRPAPRRR